MASERLPRPPLAAPDGRGTTRMLSLRRAQFESLAMPLADSLFGTAVRLVRDRTRAEDLVQETMLTAWKNFGRFELGTNFRAWIFKILTFLYMNYRRTVRTGEVPLEDERGEVPPAPEISADPPPIPGTDWEALYPQLVEDELKRALERLEEGQREVLLLVTLGEFSYADCAEALKIPVGTVMSRLHRARQRLQQDLAEYAKEHGLGKESKS